VLLAGHFILWIESLYLTTVASASILVASSPIVLAALGFVFLRERIAFSVVAAIVAGVGGAVLMSIGDTVVGASDAPNPMLGNLMASVATVLFSAYFLIGRVVRQKVDWIAYVFPVYVVVAITTVSVALVRGVPLFGHPLLTYALCLAMAVGPQIIGHGSFSFAVRYFSATLLGLLGLTEPLGATAYAYVLFGEVPSLKSACGMAIVLLAVASALLLSRRYPIVASDSSPVRVD
jgi:drug/metabolite transporter (DMT)-like permease